MLYTTDPAAFRRAVALEDLDAICRVPGIGRKTAQRLVLELKDKIGAVPAGGGGVLTACPSRWLRPATPGPRRPRRSSRWGTAAARRLRPRPGGAEAVEAPSVETLVRLALKQLYRG